MRDAWTLDPAVVYLNHGAFGACPAVVLDAQARWRARLEREPVLFLGRELEPLLDDARVALAAFVGAAPEDLAFVGNATAGVNAVLRSLRFEPGDEILVTDHAYNACRNVVDWVAGRTGARVVTARAPFPLAAAEELAAPVLAAATPRTRIAMLDHVASQTALVWPLAELVAALQGRGIDVLVDGAHAPGMIPLDVAALGAAYYTGNCHKWLCAPKGAGFLVARRDRHDGLVPPVVSHGLNDRRPRSRFHLLFDWMGTQDPSPVLCVPEAIRAVADMCPGGWPEVRARNHALALAGRDVVCAAVGAPVPCPDDLLGSMASIPLPDGDSVALERRLFEAHRIEVPVFPWNGAARRIVRLSAQLYNTMDDMRALAVALREEIR
ncbi:MAG TPA: aminotransferase class V-fold PLP-dependent enzyme [Haliangiales bacterium]|nr:aminotransferase class V-fold PLP-dependent enzyme [Haliangiales bacterium]